MPQAGIDIFLSIFDPLMPETHMFALMSGMCVRLFLNACLVVAVVLSQKSEEVRRIVRRSTFTHQNQQLVKVHPSGKRSPSSTTPKSFELSQKGWDSKKVSMF